MAVRVIRATLRETVRGGMRNAHVMAIALVLLAVDFTARPLSEPPRAATTA